MNISTKFQPGDIAYTLDTKKQQIIRFEVDTVTFCTNPRITFITYQPAGISGVTFDEEHCFATQQDLIDHLLETSPDAQHSGGLCGEATGEATT